MRSPVFALAGSLASAATGLLLLAILFGPRSILRALEGANYKLVAVAFMVGVVGQLLKAERAAIMLRQHQPITFWQSFGTMVVGNGLGDLIPLGGAGLAVRPIITHRVAGIPIALASSVFAAITVFDVMGLLPLAVYVLLAAHLAQWQRMLILAALGPMLLILVLPFLAAPMRRYLDRVAGTATGRKARLVRLGDEVARGLATITSAGWRRNTGVAGLSLVIVAIAVIQLDMLLNAVTLDPSPSRLFLLSILSAVVSGIPLRPPGSGTWTTAKMLGWSGIVGPGSGGYVLLVRLMGATQTPLLALGVILWWLWSRGASSLPVGLSDLRAGAQLQPAEAVIPPAPMRRG